jgi:hypothetical protein
MQCIGVDCNQAIWYIAQRKGYCENCGGILGPIKAGNFLIFQATVNFSNWILYHRSLVFCWVSFPPVILVAVFNSPYESNSWTYIDLSVILNNS